MISSPLFNLLPEEAVIIQGQQGDLETRLLFGHRDLDLELDDIITFKKWSASGTFCEILTEDYSPRVVSMVLDGFEDNVVSYALLCNDGPCVGHVYDTGYECYGMLGVYTVPKHRNKGYARLALKNLADWLRPQLPVDSPKSVWVQNHVENMMNRNFDLRDVNLKNTPFIGVELIQKQPFKNTKHRLVELEESLARALSA